MKKRLVAILLMAALLIPTVGAMGENGKYDMDYIKSSGIMSGDENGNLNLESYVTRAEMAKMVSVIASLKEKEKISFSDVTNAHWAYDYIAMAKCGGIINGYPDNTFCPDEAVTYEAVVKMLVETFTGQSLEYPNGYWSKAINSGYMTGVNAVIGRKALRGDVAKMICNAYEADAERLQSIRLEPETLFDLTEDVASVETVKMTSGGGGGMANIAVMGGMADGAVSVQYASLTSGMSDFGMGDFNTEEYVSEDENIFKNAKTSPLSTFSIDVDTASYSNMRRFLTGGNMPSKGSVRTEELINYFEYDYPQPDADVPFSITTEVGDCPWSDNKLVMIGLKGRELTERVPSNITLLIDTSGSMYSENKLPLVKKAMELLLENLDGQDRISIVTYAGGTEVKLDGVAATDKKTILSAIDELQAYGSTAGASGIRLAYETAMKNKVEGNNRVILCTDGDFNVGESSTADLKALIEEKRDSGIYLSVLGFGMGNYKDSRMETLADYGNGNYAYIDNVREAKKVLVDDMTKTLFTIAKDVKLQIEFNPQKVKEYRLVGYENRVLNNEDFDNDKKDAGELGAGHTVTAFYEIVENESADVDSTLKYQQYTAVESDDIMTVKFRYKEPDADESKLCEKVVSGNDYTELVSNDFIFASAVAGYGMILNDSEYAGTMTYDDVITLAEMSLGEDGFGLRSEFVQIVSLAKVLDEMKANDE